MIDHPLTDAICDQIQDSIHPCDPENMRAAADWQLQKVNDFFDNYKKTVTKMNPGYIPSLTELLSLMNQAMRPTTTQDNND